MEDLVSNEKSIKEKVAAEYVILLKTINTFLSKSKEFNIDDITKNRGTLISIILSITQLRWMSDSCLKDKMGEAGKKCNAVEQKIFHWLVKAAKSEGFKESVYKLEWQAWCVVSRLIWPPDKSRFGSNLKRLYDSKTDEVSSSDIIQAWAFIKSIWDETTKKLSFGRDLGRLWYALWNLHKMAKKKMIEMADNNKTIPENLKNASIQSRNKCRNFIISIANKQRKVFSAEFAMMLKDKNEILIEWYGVYIKQLEKESQDTTGAENELQILKTFKEFLDTFS